MDHTDQEIDRAEQLVADRCEAAVARFLDVCESHAQEGVVWESNVDPWSFRVTFDGEKWIMDDIDLEIDGVEELFEDEDLESREGVDHVICSIMIPLAMEAALGDYPGRSAEDFMSEMESSSPRIDKQ